MNTVRTYPYSKLSSFDTLDNYLIQIVETCMKESPRQSIKNILESDYMRVYDKTQENKNKI